MVPREIKERLGRSFEQMRILDETTTLKKCSNEIARALRDADFPEWLVTEIEGKIQKIIDDTTNEEGSEKCTLIYKTMLEELSSILDPRNSAPIQGKRESIVMFIGLKGGFEKSVTCARYARYHMKMGFKPALVCADTFASDLLKKASKDEFPVYTSCKRDPPAKIASEGIAKFRKDRRDFIVVDTTARRHTQCSAFFVEMRRLANALKPDLVIFVIDGSVGKDAFLQARAFRESFPAGVAIVTKITTHTKSLGALAAVAAAECPMIFSTKGDKGKEFKVFEAESFVRQLMPNQDHEREDKTPEFAYTLGEMNTYFKKVCGYERRVFRGPKQLVDTPTMKLYIQIMDNMTSEELDKSSLSYERLVQISLQSKVTMVQVRNMMITYQKMAKAWTKLEERMRKEHD